MKPLEYWKANETRFPVLSLVARKYLGIPASSAASERFFSQGALINTKLRNRLTKPTFEKIICLKSWGIFRNEEEEVKEKEEMLKKEEKNKEDKDIEDISERLYFYIPEIE